MSNNKLLTCWSVCLFVCLPVMRFCFVYLIFCLLAYTAQLSVCLIADWYMLSCFSLANFLPYFECLLVCLDVYIYIYLLTHNSGVIDNKYNHRCDHAVTLSGHVPYGRRHVVPSAVLLAGVHASPAKPILAGV